MPSGMEIVHKKIVNFIRSHSKKHRMFSELCKGMEVDAMGLLYNAEYASSTEEKFYGGCFISTAARVAVFLAQQRHLMFTNFQDNLACKIVLVRTQIV